MRHEADTPGLIAGLLFAAIALLGLWSALAGGLDGRLLGWLLPACLVTIGLVGLTSTRQR